MLPTKTGVLAEAFADIRTALKKHHLATTFSWQDVTQCYRRSRVGAFTRSGIFQVKAAVLELLDAESREPVKVARVGQPLVLKLVAKAETDVPRLVLGYMLRDRSGHIVLGHQHLAHATDPREC